MSDAPPNRFQARCCPCTSCPAGAMSRRSLLKAGSLTIGGMAIGQVAWSALAAQEGGEAEPVAPARAALKIKPVLTYDVPKRREATSWRGWGGIETEQQAKEEVARITGELEKIKAAADFPLELMPVSAVKNPKEMEALVESMGQADAIILYPAGGWMNMLDVVLKPGKPVIAFMRHRSGPVYLYYEIISNRWIRRHTDKPVIKGVDDTDVVVDSLDELTWRLRSLCGLKNTMGAKVICIGGPDAWAQPKDVVPNLVRAKWKMDLQTVSYPELGKLIQAAMGDPASVALAKKRAAAYLKIPGTKLETELPFVENAFLLEQVFRNLMTAAGTRYITINNCMGTIMPMAKTTACLTLSLLNDEGYQAYCESDFVVIPSGILAVNIADRPNFLNDPTYPHDHIITLAHCTAPRRMDGKNLEDARILTHFESDWGAAPKVEMKKGTKVTNIIPDFASAKWIGLAGEVADAPFLPICRSQIEMAYQADDLKVAQNMPGFHWMTIYGDYLREIGYAIKRVPIAWEVL